MFSFLWNKQQLKHSFKTDIHSFELTKLVIILISKDKFKTASNSRDLPRMNTITNILQDLEIT